MIITMIRAISITPPIPTTRPLISPTSAPSDSVVGLNGGINAVVLVRVIL